MARRPRISIAGIPQHVVQRGNNRGPIFFADADYRFYLDCLWDAAAKHGCDVHHYVLMTNHVHLLVTPATADALMRTMHDMGRRYVQQRINRVYGRTGTLWEGRYKACLIDSTRYFLACCRYIELNPVRAGLVERPEDYRWSSHRHYAYGTAAAHLVDHAEYVALGAEAFARQEAYRSMFHERGDEPDANQLRATINGNWPVGDDQFKDSIEAALKRTVRRSKPGRRNFKCGPGPN